MVKFAPTIRLNSGYDIPVIGLSTYRKPVSEFITGRGPAWRPDCVTEQAVKDAIDAGCRHIDSALLNDNELEIGAAIRTKIEERVIKREDIFVTSKLWNIFHRAEWVEDTCRLSLTNLGLEYLDMYVAHWPTYKEGQQLLPTAQEEGYHLYTSVDLLSTWLAMEALVVKGLVKSIGVSNYNSLQLNRVLGNATILPAVNQIEVSPFKIQRSMMSLCYQFGIVVMSFCPFGSPIPDSSSSRKKLINIPDEPLRSGIAKKYNKQVSQITLRYLIQIGILPLPKSVIKERIQKYFDIFDFELTEEEIVQITVLGGSQRTVPANK